MARCETCGSDGLAADHMHLTCIICGFVGAAGLGWWACHADADETPVCTGRCWREYMVLKDVERGLKRMVKKPPDFLKFMEEGDLEIRLIKGRDADQAVLPHIFTHWVQKKPRF